MTTIIISYLFYASFVGYLTDMKKTGSIGLCVLFLFCSYSFVQGEDNSNSSTSLQNVPMASTSSPPQRSFTVRPESLSKATRLPASSEGGQRAAADLFANGTLSQTYNDTANSTVAPGSSTGAAGTTVNTPASINNTSVPGNRTDSRDEYNLSAGDKPTTAASNTSLSITTATITPLSKVGPETSTSALPTRSQTPPASTGPRITTSSLATSTQSRGKSSTVTNKGTSGATITPTTTTTITTTTQTTEFSSTPVLAKARVDNPSELNVGDDTEYIGSSTDPLLAGLVSTFVVTAAIVALLFFLKSRHRNERPEFRRLQDLPMDDMMEDTPLSMYSY